MDFPDGRQLKNLSANVRDAGDTGLISSGEIPLEEKMTTNSGHFLPAKSHEQRSPVSYNPKGHKESDTTEWTELNH